MKCSRSATAPDWFQSDNSKMYYSATNGSSPFNQWYEFDDREDALELIAFAFTSQSFVDRFIWFNGEIYTYDQFTTKSMEAAESADDYVLKEDAKVADISDMVEAQSPF